MKLKKTSVLLFVSIFLLSGCNDSNKIGVVSNSDYLLYGEISNDHSTLVTSLEEFTNLYNSNLNYLVLFTSEGCSHCMDFQPLITQYINETHQLVVEVTGDDQFKIQNQYKEKFFPESNIVFPSLFIKLQNDEIYCVNYSSYMQTFRALKNHLSKKVKTEKYSYFCGKIDGKTPIIDNLSTIEFSNSELFKNRLLQKLPNSEKNVVITTSTSKNLLSKYEKDLTGNLNIINQLELDDSTTDEMIAQYL